MVTVLNKPEAKYKIEGWKSSLIIYSFDENIAGIENDHVLCYSPSSLSSNDIFLNKPKLSLLQGKAEK